MKLKTVFLSFQQEINPKTIIDIVVSCIFTIFTNKQNIDAIALDIVNCNYLTFPLNTKLTFTSTMIGLADCNNFFVSCERAQNHALENTAVVVLSNNDGCVVARSNEAKRLGIKMGQPAFQIKDLIQEKKVIAMSGNHLLYREISLRIHDIFRRFAPSTLDYSVDEAFLNMTGIPDTSLPDIGEAIWKACWDEEHIPVTLGFAPTKTLAKIATEKGKSMGTRVMVLSEPTQIKDILKTLPINELWGIGRRLTKRLYLKGVYTIADFYDMSLTGVRKELGVNGERSWLELHGSPCIELSHVDRDLQDSISETRTFPVDIEDYDYLRARIAIYAAHCSKRLRAMQGECRRLTIFLQTNRFSSSLPVQTPQLSIEFSEPVSDAVTISKAGIEALDKIFNPHIGYKRAGIILSEITHSLENQPSLFDYNSEEAKLKRRNAGLMKVIDSLNKGVGPHTLKLASQLTLGHIGHNEGYSNSFGAPLPEY